MSNAPLNMTIPELREAIQNATNSVQLARYRTELARLEAEATDDDDEA